MFSWFTKKKKKKGKTTYQLSYRRGEQITDTEIEYDDPHAALDAAGRGNQRQQRRQKR